MNTIEQLIHQAKKNFEGPFQSTFENMMYKNSFGSFREMILERLIKSEIDVLSLFSLAFENLPEDEVRPNENIAALFLILSELKTISSEYSDLALDAMLYSRHDKYTMYTKRDREELLARFAFLTTKSN